MIPPIETIYVDPLIVCIPGKRWRWDRSCHMFVAVETPLDALHEFAELIGLKRQWFQNDRRLPHYDLHPSRRRVAVRNGALEVNRRRTVEVIREWQRFRTQEGQPNVGI